MPENSVVLSTRGSQFQQIESLVLDSVTSPHSKRAYRRALREFIAWTQSNCLLFNKAAVQRYRSELEQRSLSSSSINVRLSAIRKLAQEAADNGLLDPDIAAGIARVRGTRGAGIRVGHWLTRDQAEELLSLPDPTTCKGKRDRVILALLVGCGVRRQELVQVTVEHIQQRDGRWVLANLMGKGGRVRTVAIPAWAKVVVDHWVGAAGITTGRLLRAINKSDRISAACIGAPAVFKIVRGYGIDLKQDLAPHDLRRTFAKLAHKGRAPLEQIQIALGHSSIQTTERYLGVRQDLVDAPCDHLGIGVLAE